MKYERPGSDTPRPVRSAARIRRETSDRYRYTSLAPYTPEKITSIMRAADSGDIEQLCLAARDMLERNWDIIGALDQRASALCGAGCDIQPGDDTPRAREIADAFARELADAGGLPGPAGGEPKETFDELVRNLCDAVVLPFAAAEIDWRPGGGFAGFSSIEPHHFTLRDSYSPRLVTAECPDGMELPQYGFIVHRFRRRPDPAHGGLARVLLWLHCFQNWPIKDLFSFIERFGMPFVVATVDNKTYDTEGDVLRALIRNFGPDGGGVFSQGTQVQLLNAANTGGDNVYFSALKFTHDAIYTLLVGQLASSGDSSGMSNGDAQTAVRQDILKADASSIASTIRAQLAAPWTLFRYGADAPVPKIHFKVESPEDLAQLAMVVNTLSQAGFRADETELSARFGLKLKYEPQTPGMGALPMAGESHRSAQGESPGGESASAPADQSPPGATRSDLSDALETWLGPVADDIAAAAELSDAELDRKLRSGKFAAPGSSAGIEKIMAEDMENQYSQSGVRQSRTD